MKYCQSENCNNIVKIILAIENITGFIPEEIVSPDRYCLKLGKKEPLEIGYDKKRRLLSENTMRYSAHVKMLSVVCDMMKSPKALLDWIILNSDTL